MPDPEVVDDERGGGGQTHLLSLLRGGRNPPARPCTWPEGPCRCNPWWPALRDFSPTTVACETAVHPSSPSKAKDDGIAQEFGAVSTAQCEARGKQNPILMHGAERRCRLEHATVRVARGGKPCRFRPRPPVDPPPQPSLATCSRGAPKHHGVCAVRRAEVSQAYGLVGTCLRHSGTPVIRARSLTCALA